MSRRAVIRLTSGCLEMTCHWFKYPGKGPPQSMCAIVILCMASLQLDQIPLQRSQISWLEMPVLGPGSLAKMLPCDLFATLCPDMLVVSKYSDIMFTSITCHVLVTCRNSLAGWP